MYTITSLKGLDDKIINYQHWAYKLRVREFAGHIPVPLGLGPLIVSDI